MTINEIQDYLKQHELNAYIVTRNNMFIGQDILPEENKIKELTGFSGSAGNLIIFQDRAVLLVDGRYDIQACRQTDSSTVEVVCTRDSVSSWIHHNVHEPQKFIYNAWCHSISEVDYWRRSLNWHLFIEDRDNLLGSRVSPKQAEIFEMKEEFVGVSSEEKISYLADFMAKNRLDAYLLCESDSVSWLMNLRSDLIPYSCILRAYALVHTGGEVSLYTSDFSKLVDELSLLQGKSIGINFSRTPKKVQDIIKIAGAVYRGVNNPITDWKSIKNPVEISGFKACHVRDGEAVCRFLSWLDKNYTDVDELGCVAKLHELRQQQKDFYSESFATIAGYGANGAIIHYQPTAETNQKLNAGSLLLLDSGAHYYDGTTDITRTIALGKPTDAMIDDYTMVLKAHIALSSQIFPIGTIGSQLDAITRSALWNKGKDYSHGTGHGVGYCLNVHEGPQSISLKNPVPLQSGMVCSIEPGYYLEGQYGVRIENLALIIEAQEGWLKFEPLTLVPYDHNLINKSQLTETEITWINNYHQQVGEKLLPLLDAETAQWLKNQIRPL